MKTDLSESVKNQLIQILNQNIKLEEAVSAPPAGLLPDKSKKKKEEETNELPKPDMSQSGSGGPGQEKEAPKHSWKEILLGNQPSTTPWGGELGLGDVAGMAAGGKAIGTVGQMFGGKLAQGMTNLFGGGKGSKMLGGAVGDLFGKVTTDIEALSGAPTMQAQIADIVPHQMALRWEGSGTPGWFRPLVPKSQLAPTQPKSSEEIGSSDEEKRTAARIKRLQDIQLSKKEAKYGLPPI